MDPLGAPGPHPRQAFDSKSQNLLVRRTETELIELNSEKFREVIVEHPKHLPFMR